MKKLLGIVVLGLLFGGNVLAENITIKCFDKERDSSLILNFDEGGNWINFNGRNKSVAGRQDTVLGEEYVKVEITQDKIDYFSMISSAETFTQIIINRFDGSMYQYGKINGGERYDHHYMCEKTDRKF